MEYQIESGTEQRVVPKTCWPSNGVVEAKGHRRIVPYGKFDPNDDRHLDGDAIFEIGSATKIFTPLLLSDMVLRGEVALDDSIAKFLPAGCKAPQFGGRPIALVDPGVQREGRCGRSGGPIRLR